MQRQPVSAPSVEPRDASLDIVDETDVFTRVGSGQIGGKARGLAEMDRILASRFRGDDCHGFQLDIPAMTVIATDMFDLFMEQNHLHDLALSGTRDHHIASAFQQADLPAPVWTALRSLIAHHHGPLAVRSSSLLEDALNEPFAGIYDTKMIPNNQFSHDARLRTLAESIKFVYASTYSQDAKRYRKAAGRQEGQEKMGVIVQEVVGRLHGNRHYPTLSGVGRSRNFYPLGHGQPADGVVSLALGLGKTVVDGGRVWTYCPVFPRAKPPFASTKELLDQTQTKFWAVNMGKPPSHDPTRETEYLCEGDLQQADQHGVLADIASTYDPRSDRVVIGTGASGPRVLDFAPLLCCGGAPMNDLVKRLLRACEETLGDPVEIEFAAELAGPASPVSRFALLQLRPMLVSRARVEIEDHELRGDHVLLASENVFGNDQMDSIRDIVYVKPEVFSAKDTWLIAAELAELNRRLVEAGRPYLLVTIGRLGTSEPWLGVPVRWPQVCGARVIVETSSDEMMADMSQGSHFFHNVTNLGVLYFSADRTGAYPLNWDWLRQQPSAHDGRFVRHATVAAPLAIKVDGGRGRGLIAKTGE